MSAMSRLKNKTKTKLHFPNNRIMFICFLEKSSITFVNNFKFLKVIPALTFGLGVWQIRRREWKLSLIENLESRTSAPPIPLPQE